MNCLVLRKNKPQPSYSSIEIRRITSVTKPALVSRSCNDVTVAPPCLQRTVSTASEWLLPYQSSFWQKLNTLSSPTLPSLCLLSHIPVLSLPLPPISFHSLHLSNSTLLSSSRSVQLNGERLLMVDNETFPELKPRTLRAGRTIAMPPMTIGFYVIKNINAYACRK